MESARRRFDALTPEGDANPEVAQVVVGSILSPPLEWTQKYVGDHPWSWGNYKNCEGQSKGLERCQYVAKWGNAHILTYTQTNYWREHYPYVGSSDDCKSTDDCKKQE
jgi:hypothetical protein